MVMPVYNRADMIGRAIESVLSQSYPHFELVVVDDGSTDDTEKVLGSYTDPRFSYLRQPNAGAAAART